MAFAIGMSVAAALGEKKGNGDVLGVGEMASGSVLSAGVTSELRQSGEEARRATLAAGAR